MVKFNHNVHKGKTKVYGKKQGTHLPDEPLFVGRRFSPP
jgi:hypothetical protein